MYNAESDSAGFSYPAPPAPPGPGVNTTPFTPPAGYMPGYVPPMPQIPTDAPPAYSTLDTFNKPSPGQPSVTTATTNQQAPPTLPSSEGTAAAPPVYEEIQ